jgi:hypothetical protein
MKISAMRAAISKKYGYCCDHIIDRRPVEGYLAAKPTGVGQ